MTTATATRGLTATNATTTAAPAQLPRIFFIVGCQKSGTTWLQRTLNGHPRICCNGETYLAPFLLPLMRKALADYNQRQKVGPEGQFDDADLAALLKVALGRLFHRWSGGDPLEAVGEKTPEHALCLPDLQRLFPAMRVVHVIRDGRDVAVSGWHHNLRKKGDAFLHKFPDMPAYITYLLKAHWVPYITAARRFGETYPDRYFEVRYEALHEDSDAQLRKILPFLDVASDPEARTACAAAGSFETLTQGRPRGEEDSESFFRKGVVGDWKNHFDDRCTETFLQHGGDLLTQLGYA